MQDDGSTNFVASVGAVLHCSVLTSAFLAGASVGDACRNLDVRRLREVITVVVIENIIIHSCNIALTLSDDIVPYHPSLSTTDQLFELTSSGEMKDSADKVNNLIVPVLLAGAVVGLVGERRVSSILSYAVGTVGEVIDAVGEVIDVVGEAMER
jgi:hypothetical protein